MPYSKCNCNTLTNTETTIPNKIETYPSGGVDLGGIDPGGLESGLAGITSTTSSPLPATFVMSKREAYPPEDDRTTTD